MTELASDAERALAARVVKVMALLERNRQMVDIGAYARGTNPELDQALAVEPALDAFLRQSEGGVARADAMAMAARALGGQP